MSTKIVKVVLGGFKRLYRAYELNGPTLLCGVNGVGKSACWQGIIYALSGRVPTGSVNDEVAKYFPAQGGWVELHDEAGNWIRRGIVRDHDKAKVSETLEVSGTPEGRQPDLAPWYAADAVLNLSKFLGLSEEKRREFTLRLCGSSEADTSTLMAELEGEYAREIAGEAATPSSFEQPEHIKAETMELWRAWARRLGLREVLRSHIVAGRSLTETCLKLSDAAKEERLTAGKAAKDARAASRELEKEAKGARAASRELEKEAKGARAAADEIRTRSAEVEALRHDLARAQQRAAGAAEVQKSFNAATADLEKVSGELYRAKQVVAGLPLLGERPVPPEGDHRREEAFRLAGVAQMELTGALKLVAALTEDEKALDHADEDAGKALEDLETHRASKLGRVVGLLGEIPDSADPGMPELRAAVDDLSAEWQARLTRFVDDESAARAKLEAIRARRSDWRADAIAVTAAEEEARARVKAQSQVLAELEKAQSGSAIAHRTASAEYEARAKARREAETRALQLGAAWKKASESEASAKARLAEVGTPSSTAADIEIRLDTAQAALERAEKAAGAVAAYNAAIQRAEQNKVLEASWKALEGALKTVREKLIGAATAPIVDVMNEVLVAAQRPERAYLKLENERGRPIFELGWVHEGQPVAVGPLSTGENAVFCAALSLAITLRSEGRRVLLFDATNVTENNREPFLATLAPWAEQLDALVVEVAAMSPPEVSDAWTVLELTAQSGKEVTASPAAA
jgi:DNA repair exonuclease SbcCD ATPase subunit